MPQVLEYSADSPTRRFEIRARAFFQLRINNMIFFVVIHEVLNIYPMFSLGKYLLINNLQPIFCFFSVIRASSHPLVRPRSRACPATQFLLMVLCVYGMDMSNFGEDYAQALVKDTLPIPSCLQSVRAFVRPFFVFFLPLMSAAYLCIPRIFSYIVKMRLLVGALVFNIFGVSLLVLLNSKQS